MSDRTDQVEDRLKSVVGSLLTKLDEKDSAISDLKRQVSQKSLGVTVSPEYVDSIESKRNEAKELSNHLSDVEKRLILALQTITLKYNEAVGSFDGDKSRFVSRENRLKGQTTSPTLEDAPNVQLDKIAELQAEIKSLKAHNNKLVTKVERYKSTGVHKSSSGPPPQSGRRPPVYFVPPRPADHLGDDIEDNGVVSSWITGMFGNDDPDPMEKALARIKALDSRNKELESAIGVALEELRFWRDFPDSGGVNMRMEEMWRRAVGALLMRNDLDVMKVAFVGWRDVCKAKKNASEDD